MNLMKQNYYLYHSESDCLFIETDELIVKELFENSPELIELDYSRYLELLNEQDELDKQNKT